MKDCIDIYAFEFLAVSGKLTRVGIVVLVGPKLRGIDKDRSDDDIAFFTSRAHKRQMAFMQGAHGGHEAYLFALQRGESKEVATAMRIRALILSGDPKAADFRQRTEKAGFKLSSSHSSANSTFACIEKLWRVYESDPQLYSDTLRLLMDCWRGEKWSLAANIIGGMSVFLRAYGKEYNPDRFLKKVGAADLAALNKNRVDDPRKDYCYAYAMFKLYNKGGGKGSLEPYALYEYRG